MTKKKGCSKGRYCKAELITPPNTELIGGRMRSGAEVISQIMNVNVPRDKFMICLGGFLLVAICLAGWGVVVASRMEINVIVPPLDESYGSYQMSNV